MALRIEDYALVGDCRTAALIGRDGSADWLCWPRFNSAACFAALLGTPEHGRWLIASADPNARVSRRYRDDTLILETDFETPDGAVTRDRLHAAARGVARSRAHRHRAARAARHAMRTRAALRLWRDRALGDARDDGSLEAIAGPDMTVLRTPIELRGEDFKTVGDFIVSEGEIVPFVLSYGRSYRAAPGPIDPSAALSDTEVFWRNWSVGLHRNGRMGRACAPLAHHAQGADVSPNRRHRRSSHHLAPRTVWRNAQLGLPLLLAQGRDLHPAQPHAWRLLR